MTDKPNTFVLFKEQDKKSEKHPDMTGSIILPDGTKMRIACWERTSNSGKEYLSGQVSEMINKAPQQTIENKPEQDNDLLF